MPRSNGKEKEDNSGRKEGHQKISVEDVKMILDAAAEFFKISENECSELT